jgi:hypothetical protein
VAPNSLLRASAGLSGSGLMVATPSTTGTVAWPGQAGNPVGYAAAPGYSGTLIPHATTGWVANTTYSFLDVDTGTGGVSISVSGVTFIGCRFQSNDQGNYNVQVTGANATFKYCTFSPRTAFVASPPGSIWPSAGAGQNTTTFTDGVNCTPGTQGYQYGIQFQGGTGYGTIQHCDIWGFGNSIDLVSAGTNGILIDNNWIHDPANSSPNGYHTDGPGFLNGPSSGNPPQNVTISNNTICFIGNTQPLAMQSDTIGARPYANIIVSGNYFSGGSYCTSHYQPHQTGVTGVGLTTGCQFVGNILATDIQWYYGPVYSDPTSIYNFASYSNLWRNNKLRVMPGTVPAAGATFSFTSADDGKYVYPNNTLNATTDYAG